MPVPTGIEREKRETMCDNDIETHQDWVRDDAKEAWSGDSPMRVRDLKALVNSWDEDYDNLIVCFATTSDYVNITTVRAPCHKRNDSDSTECQVTQAVQLWSEADPNVGDRYDYVDWRDL